MNRPTLAHGLARILAITVPIGALAAAMPAATPTAAGSAAWESRIDQYVAAARKRTLDACKA
jgi:hypothetical protein